MHRCAEAQRRAHNAYGKAKVTRGRHLHGVLRKELRKPFLRKHGVIIAFLQKTRIYGKRFGVLQYLIYAAARLYGAGYGQIAVPLDIQRAFYWRAVFVMQPPKHCRRFRKRGFYQPARRRSLREFKHNVWRKAFKPRFRLRRVASGYVKLAQRVFSRSKVGVYP